MEKLPPLTPATIVISILVVGAIIYSVTSPSVAMPVTGQNLLNTSSTTATQPGIQAQLAQQAQTQVLEARVQNLEDRIADCQNEIYAADSVIYNMNYAVTQVREAQQSNQAPDLSVLQYGNQVADLVGHTICFAGNEAAKNQSNATNQTQQQDSLLTQ